MHTTLGQQSLFNNNDAVSPSRPLICCASRPKVKTLNLYAGLGGNRKLWESCDVTAVEQNEKIAEIYAANFPNDTVIVGDAHKFLQEHYDEFHFIWSSPPCQSHSKMMIATKHKNKKYPDMTLWQEIIFLRHFCKSKFVVENVQPYYAPVVTPSVQIGRHLFWANFPITKIKSHTPKDFIGNGTIKHADELKKELGFDFQQNIYYSGNHDPCQVLRNCVAPELGLHVFEAMLRAQE